MRFRKLGKYPPYTYCTLVTLSAKKEMDVIDAASNIKNFLVASFASKNVDVIGPSEPFITMYESKFRRNLLIKYKNYDDISGALETLMRKITSSNKISISIDVDTYEDY
jgi:primosomal protein N' (replication factor Y)